jgi:uncharacterized protein (TIGR01777 family)
MTPPRRIVIAGASGFLGSALAARLSAEGREVLRLVRPGSRSGAARDASAVAWDPPRGALDPAALAGVDGAVNFAGATIAGVWTAAKRRAIRDSRVAATSLLATTLASLTPPPRVLLSASAVGAYGDRGDEELTERAEYGSGFLADVARAWEGAAAPARAAGIRVVHPRLAMVLGRGGGALPPMRVPFRLGCGGRLGSGRQWWSWIGLDDGVEALVRLLDDERFEGPVNLAAPGPVTNADFTRALSRALHRPAFLAVPAFALRLALGGFADEALLASARVAPARLLELGYRFRHPDIGSALRSALGTG